MNTDKTIDNKAVLSVVLGSYNRKEFLKLTLASIRDELKKFTFKTEIIVVDGGSTDGTIKWLTAQKDIISIIQHNRGKWQGKPIEKRNWGYFMNLAFKTAQGKYVCMLSDDCLVIPGAIVNGYMLFESQLSADEKLGGLAFYFRDLPEEKEYHVNSTINNTMMINHGLFLKKAMEDVHFINEISYHFYHADDDLALKLKNEGYSIKDSPDSFIEHFIHANIALRETVYESERKDFSSLIENWKDKFLIEDVDKVNYKTFRAFNYEHKEIKAFYRLYKKDVLKRKLKTYLFKGKRLIKNIFFELYYTFIYMATSIFLLFTNPKKLREKIRNTWRRIFHK